MSCQITSGGILDSLLIQFGNAAFTWQTSISPLAKKIFFILFGMEFMWQLTVKKIFAGDIEKLWVFFFTRAVLGFFFAKYIVNVDLYRQIIEYFAAIGGKVGGFSLSLTPGHNFTSASPSAIVANFSCIADAIHQTTDSTGSLQYLTLKFALAIMEVILFVVLVLIAFYLIKIILQTYFLLYVGFLLTGFAGSSWTMQFWQNYLRAVAGMAIKFLAVCFLFGILQVQMEHWVIQVNAAQDLANLGSVILQVLGSAIIIALLSHQLPEWAAATLAGSVAMKFMSQIGAATNVVLPSSSPNIRVRS